jgi:hypothetical protein
MKCDMYRIHGSEMQAYQLQITIMKYDSSTFSHYSSDSLSKLRITTDAICSKFTEAANIWTVLQKYFSMLLR